MEYNCTNCNYATSDKSNFQKHLKSQKHLKKEQQLQNETQLKLKYNLNRTINYQCSFCSNTFSTAGSLARHKRACGDKQKVEMSFINAIEKKDTVIEKKDSEIEKKDIELKQLREEVKYLKTLITNAGGVIKTSVSALSYVAKNYNGAPILKKLKDYSYIKEKEVDDGDSEESEDKFDLMETLIYHNNKETIQEYLGNIIVEAYKKNDPANQSIWNSDTVRLTYVIRELIDKKPDWTVDKKGIKTAKYIINPLLEYIREQATHYLDEHKLENYIDESEIRIKKICDKINACGKIIVSIDNKSLSKLILKYIAPHFYLAKENMHLIEN